MGVREIDNFLKRREYLVCVDSDGCVMDTMEIKHRRCFGPCLIEEWGLDEWREEILARWCEINLYTMTRGVNRFRGLMIALSEISWRYRRIEDLADIGEWVENSDELSEKSLEREIEKNPISISLPKALSWSREVNRLSGELKFEPFDLAREALMAAHDAADVAIVSGASYDAVVNEWTKHSLIEHTDVIMAQNSGSKIACIKALLDKGYSTDRVLMCGDSPGDLRAAEECGVHFFPILVGRESESWYKFTDTALPLILSGNYSDMYALEKKNEFLENLKE
jgi:phosphoglycolate phosphatase-like HAD superfamily hydrolase